MEYLLWVAVALVAYGLIPPLTSVVTTAVPPAVALFLSTAVFLLLTLGVLLVTGTADPAYATTPAAGYVYVAGLFLAVGILAYYSALEAGPVSVVVPIYGLFIVGSSVVGIVFLGEELTSTRAAGIAVAVLAIYLAASGDR
ncbi:EamA family transporter [Natronorubrum sp. A-ect3]|uniref:EamA family transporter n=1 Tax=Natronorubrum sp. A-ect3 TaxID=3242698 RepID=UPI00359EC606